MKDNVRHTTDTPEGDAPTAPVIATPDHSEYRKALSCFGTGVTVVTARHQAHDVGMTCNSFSSVSLNPRLVLWSIRKEASSLEAFTQSGGFMVSVLAHDQAELAMQFAKGSMADRFAGVSVTRHASDRLRLQGAVAWFDCAVHQLIDAGDHMIVIGAVRDFGWQNCPALAYSQSRFGQFLPL
jgi:flavin reductase (DIM6/NTAB) family NADH-FMN oxidoreductase RutF